jgi:hypothetical protein
VRGTEIVKSVQKDMNAIAERVQASNPRWYRFILTGKIAHSKIVAPLNHLIHVCLCSRIQCLVDICLQDWL